MDSRGTWASWKISLYRVCDSIPIWWSQWQKFPPSTQFVRSKPATSPMRCPKSLSSTLIFSWSSLDLLLHGAIPWDCLQRQVSFSAEAGVAWRSAVLRSSSPSLMNGGFLHLLSGLDHVLIRAQRKSKCKPRKGAVVLKWGYKNLRYVRPKWKLSLHSTHSHWPVNFTSAHQIGDGWVEETAANTKRLQLNHRARVACRAYRNQHPSSMGNPREAAVNLWWYGTPGLVDPNVSCVTIHETNRQPPLFSH